MDSSKPSETYLRIPEWLRVKLPESRNFCGTTHLLEAKGLHTVCQSARCPNIFECFSRNVATFLILGNACTRNCAFCNIQEGHVTPPDPDEPAQVAEASKELGLKHVVVTSVTRDDLPDGGAGHFAATVREIQAALPDASIEVLIPDFQGDEAALRTVLDAGPDIVNHNVETVPHLYAAIRPQADYQQSLTLLERVAAAGFKAKSGCMVGLGETDEQIHVLLQDLHRVGCHMVTIGQYMRPTRKHPPVQRYVHPDVFAEYAAYGRSLGIPHVFSEPLVRSSYNAADFVD